MLITYQVFLNHAVNLIFLRCFNLDVTIEYYKILIGSDCFMKRFSPHHNYRLCINIIHPYHLFSINSRQDKKQLKVK